MIRSRAAFLVIVALCTHGCAKKTASDAAPAPVAAASGPAYTSAPSAKREETIPALDPSQSLFGHLAQEAKSRPNIQPNADAVFAALERIGAPVPQKEQTLGTTYKAAYCVGGFTADRALAINVCEYADGAAAAAGRDLSKSMFPSLTTRDVWAHKTTTLAIVRSNPEAAALEKKLAAAYLAL